MVDAEERGSDETQPQAKGYRVKYAKSNSLRTQQAIARYGKSARHPLCLAVLELLRQDVELSARTKDVVLAEEDLNSAKQLKEEAQAAIKKFTKRGKEKEANLWVAQLRKIDKLLPEAQTRYEASVELRSFRQEWRRLAVAQFNCEYDAVIRAGNVKALRALQRVLQRWGDKKAFLGDSDRRTLEMLEMLREEASKAVVAKEGNAQYLESARSGSRALSDEAWQGLLTAREIQSRLVDAPGDRDAKEVRRLAGKLGIRLAEDQRGRKRKPYLRKQKTKRPRGCPRTKAELVFKEDIAQTFDELIRGSRGRAARQPSKDQFWDSSEARRTAAGKRSANPKGKARKRRR